MNVKINNKKKRNATNTHTQIYYLLISNPVGFLKRMQMIAILI